MKIKTVIMGIFVALSICLLFSCNNSTPAPEKATYKIVYYGNGSTGGEVREQSGEEGSSLFISDGAVLEYKCHSFSSWNTAKDGSGRSYNPGDEYKVEANLVLFAQWNESHDWTTVEGKASTCSEQGWKSYQVCSACGKSDKVLLPLAEHSYLETVADEYLKSPATCTESAVYYKNCSMCHSLTDETFSYGKPLGHDYIAHEAKASTCTVQGWNAYQTCSRCSYSTKELSSLAEHNYLETVADEYLKSAATCTESAVYYKSCSMCHSLTDETFSYGKPLGHDYIDHEAKASTCTVQGWNAYQTCSRCPYSTKELLSLAEHNYINKVDDKYLSENATCSKEAVYYKSCSACGTRSSETFNSGIYLEHNLIHTDAKEPTCTTAGWDAYDSCTRCGYTTKVEKKALGHDKVSHVAKAATCTEDGYAAYDTCTRCSYSTYSVISATGHKLTDHAAKAPTCTEIGWNAYKTCSKCDYSTYAEKAALGHDIVSHTSQAPTCTAVGWDAYNTCSRCDYTTYSEKKALGHTLVTKASKASTCTVQGWESYQECSVCGYSTKVLLDLAEHNFVETVAETYLKSAATCEDKAVYYKSCSVCGAKSTETFEYGNPLGHDKRNYGAKASTCQEQGWNAYEACTRCTYSTRVLLPLAEHDYIEKVDDKYLSENATCSKEAIYYRSCSICGAKSGETFNSGIYLVHDIIHTDAKEPTCTTVGWDAYDKCTRCTYTTYVEKPALNHLLEHVDAKAVSCTEEGWNAYDYCTHEGCGYTTKVSIPATGHTLTQYAEKAATCTEDGNNAYEVCSVCGYSTYEKIGKLGHNLTHHEAKAATCEEIGWNAYDTCSRCDYSTYVETGALGHNKVNHTAKAATCTEDGYAAYETCTRCTYSTYSEIPASGHSYVDHEAQAPTCTSVGWNAYKTCSKCGDSTYVEKAALGHDYITHTAKSPTCTEIGWNEYVTCSRCDYTNCKELSATGHSYSTEWTTDSTYHWHTATCEHTDLISEKAQHTWGSDNKCTVCGIENEGSSGITIDPSEYTVALAFPGEWNGSLHVVPGVKGTVKASLSPSDTKAEYAFFFDGVRLVAEGDELVLGKGEGKLNLEEGWHVLIVMAELDDNTYQNCYVIQVSSSGTGKADTDGEV